eukprot:gnl/Chilomastix_caulleri/4031.p2 GENE.gnl/Chilomastix_caulleri/4031~~gnl/Chilomastix_caulleri/4031.p2  ORF type:complete len:74 (+),score=27.13 gnl/Chilomastix_caulleri/4031:60-281(+)
MEELDKNYEAEKQVIDDLVSKFRDWSMMDDIVPSLKAKLEDAAHILGDDCLKELQENFEKKRKELAQPDEEIK